MLSKLISILLFFIIICFLIAWHELGHLLAAKKCNVYCYEYSIGFGPIIYKNERHETKICIRAIPLGGFVKMAGEEGLNDGEVLKDNEGNDIPSDRILANKPLRKRALVLAAGGLMNVLFALICFYFYISFNDISFVTNKANSTGFVTPITTNEVTIAHDSLLANKGMETNDKIILIKTRLNDGEYYEAQTNTFKDVQNALDERKPLLVDDVQYITITYVDVSDNNNEYIIDVSRTMSHIDGKDVLSKIGLSQGLKAYEYNPLTALYGTFHFAGYYTVEIVKSFGRLFMGDFSSLSGLVGIYGTIDGVTSSTAVSFGVKALNMVYIAGAISFSLGFFNLIPFPALDGGRLFFVALEGIRKKKINPNVEATIHFVGIIVLFALMIIINIRDIIGLF